MSMRSEIAMKKAEVLEMIGKRLAENPNIGPQEVLGRILKNQWN